MKYVALLRGVNVGGKTLIKMSDLKEVAESVGFENVSTLIQSGNIIFQSDKTLVQVTNKLEKELAKRFNYESTVIVKDQGQLKKILAEVPTDWKKRKDMRCYLAFIKEPLKADDVLREARPEEGIDFVKVGDGVIYMSTLLSGLTRSGLTRLIETNIYKSITIRNYNTVKKLLERMEG